MTASSWSSWAHAPGTRSAPAWSVPLGGPPADQFDQPALLGLAVGYRKVGEPRGHQAQIEGAPGGDLRRPFDHPGPPCEPPTLFGLPP